MILPRHFVESVHLINFCPEVFTHDAIVLAVAQMLIAPRSLASKVQHRTGLFRRDRQGGVALIFSLSLPILVTAASAALDYSNWTNQRVHLQNATDAAAIAAARELSVSSIQNQDRLDAVALSVVNSQFGASLEPVSRTVKAAPNSAATGVTVTVTEPFRASALGQFLVETPMVTKATATRTEAGKICVLVLSLKDPMEGEVLMLDDAAQLTGNGCGVYSNSLSKDGISAKSSAFIKAPLMCSAGGFKLEGNPAGTYQGERRTECPKLENPLKDRPAPSAGPCLKTSKFVIGSSRDLPAGRYCGGIEIKGKNTVVTLQPSGGSDVVIVKDGQLIVDDSAKLYGRGVGIAFVGQSSAFEFKGASTIDLHAPTKGPLAGILFYGSPNALDFTDYKISSDNARTLVGTIYLPKGFFSIDATNPVADQSAYTAIIVNKMKLTKAPKLTLNTNYHQSQVPVPPGIDGQGGAVRLTN